MRGCVVRLPGSLRLRAWLHVASWRLLALEVVVLAWAGMSGRLLRLALRWQVAPRRLVLDQAENYRICSAPAHPCSSRDSSLVVSLFSDSRRLMLEYCRQGMTLGDRGKPMSETVLITNPAMSVRPESRPSRSSRQTAGRLWPLRIAKYPITCPMV